MINKLADMLDLEPGALIIGFIVIAIAIVGVVIYVNIAEKKGLNSQDKADLRELVDRAIPEGSRYQAAFAHFTEVHGSARAKRYIYYLYAFAFDPQRTDHFWVIPLRYNGGKPLPSEPFKMDAGSVAYADGVHSRIVLHLRSNQTITADVESSNVKMGKECPVNIQQPDETAAFAEFNEAFINGINEKNGVDRKGRPPRTGSWN